MLLHCTSPKEAIKATNFLTHLRQRKKSGLCGGEVWPLVLSVFAHGHGRKKVSLARLHLGSRRGEGRRREEGERARGEVSAQHWCWGGEVRCVCEWRGGWNGGSRHLCIFKVATRPCCKLSSSRPKRLLSPRRQTKLHRNLGVAEISLFRYLSKSKMKFPKSVSSFREAIWEHSSVRLLACQAFGNYRCALFSSFLAGV